jgi:bifunctional DNA-binding transcriptional regulator/antitoxin component of YhaV-PrlF toxin-antitoxin module
MEERLVQRDGQVVIPFEVRRSSEPMELDKSASQQVSEYWREGRIPKY